MVKQTDGHFQICYLPVSTKLCDEKNDIKQLSLSDKALNKVYNLSDKRAVMKSQVID